MARVTLELRGTAPLLMNNYDALSKVFDLDSLTPEERAEQAAMRDEKGNLCVPSAALWNAVLHGAKKSKVGLMNASWFIRQQCSLTEEMCTLYAPDKLRPLKKVEPDLSDTRRGHKFNKYRARVPVWRAFLTLEFDSNEIQAGNLVAFARDGGKSYGVGIDSPGMTWGGECGTFTAAFKEKT